MIYNSKEYGQRELWIGVVEEPQSPVKLEKPGDLASMLGKGLVL